MPLILNRAIMKYSTHNEKSIPLTGSLKGFVVVDYEDIVKVFGEPSLWDDGKVDAEWVVLFEDGSCIRIYNYRDGVNHLGRLGTHHEHIKRWRLGGENLDAAPHLERLLNIKIERCYTQQQ